MKEGNKNGNKVRYPTTFGITPRYDFAWAGVSLPVSYGGVTGFRTTSKSLRPSMVHDWLIYDERINGNDIFSRGEMDEIFLILCKVCGVPYWERVLMKQGLAINRNILMRWF